MKWKIGGSILGLLGLVIVGLIVAPRLINWSNFKPQLTALVYEETGKELAIDGDIDLTLLPYLTFRAADIRLVEPAFKTDAPLVAIKEISGEIGLFSLLFGELKVRSFVISEPKITLAISEEGDTNWRLYINRPAKDSAGDNAYNRSLPVDIAALDNVRIEQGHIHFRDQRTDQNIIAVDLATNVSLPDRSSPLVIEGGTTVNDKTINWKFDVTTLADLEAGDPAKITGGVTTEFLKLSTAVDLDIAPPFSLNGDLSVKATSVGAIYSWLERPLEEDPGPVNIAATFKSDKDQKISVTAKLEGKDLNAALSGDLDLGADIPMANVKLVGEVLDFARYLPPPAGNKLAPSVTRADNQINLATARTQFSQPLDLAFLDKVNATFDVRLKKIITHRITMGPVAAAGTLQAGKLSAKVEQFFLYGGDLTGDLQLNQENGIANVTANAHMEKIPFDKIGEDLALDTLPVSGIGNGNLTFTSNGSTVLLLAQNARFHMDLVLSPITGASSDSKITAAKINLARKELRGAGELDGVMTFNGRQVKLSGNVLPKSDAGNLTGMDFKVQLQSELAALTLEGARDLSDQPSTHAALDFKAGSAHDLIDWLGLPTSQKTKDAAADPVTITSKMQHEKKITTIESLAFTGPLVSAKASGKIDNSEETPLLEFDIEGDVIDIDHLLTFVPQVPQKNELTKEQAKADNPTIAFLPDKALDLSALQTFDLGLKLRLKKAVYEESEFGPIDIASGLKNGKLTTTINALQYSGSDLTADITFDTKPSLYDLTSQFNIKQWKGETTTKAVKRKITLEQGTTGQGSLTARGRSPRALVASLLGHMKLDIPGISITGREIRGFSQTTVDMTIPDAPNTMELETKTTMIIGDEKIELPVTAYLKTGRLISLVQDSDMPVDMAASIGDSKLTLQGKISNARTAPEANLEINFEAPSLTAYQKLIKDLPDVAPVNAKVNLVADLEHISLTEFAGRVGSSDLAGNLTVSLANAPRDIKGSLTSNMIDLSPFRSETPPKTTGATTTPTATGDDKYIFKDTPLPVHFLAQYDADIALKIKKLKVSPVMELDNVIANILLQDKVLTVDPFDMQKGDGTVISNFTFNAASEVPTMAYSATIHNLQVVAIDNARLKVNTHSDLTSTGNSPRKLASNLNGRMDWISRDGEINSSLLGILSFGAGNIFSSFLGGKQNVTIDCMVFRFDIENGLVTPAVAMTDTKDLVVAGSGEINLKEETLTLTIGTSARTIGVADLIVPILITGTLKSPEAIPDPIKGTKNLSAGLLNLINPVNAVDTVFGTNILGGNKPPCALAFEIVADTKAPADLTLTKEQATNSGLIGGTAKGVGNILKSVGSGIKSLFGGDSE